MTLVIAGINFDNEYIINTLIDNVPVDSAKWLTVDMAALYIATRRADKVMMIGMNYQPVKDLHAALTAKNIDVTP